MAEPADDEEWQTVRRGAKSRSLVPKTAGPAPHGACNHDKCNVRDTSGKLTDDIAYAIEKNIRRIYSTVLWRDAVHAVQAWTSTLGRNGRVNLVCIGLGAVAEASEGSHVLVQLSLLIMLRHVLYTGTLEVGNTAELLSSMRSELQQAYPDHPRGTLVDTAFTDADIRLLNELGFDAERGEGHCTCMRPGIPPPRGCLVFMPHCPRPLDARILWQHWLGRGAKDTHGQGNGEGGEAEGKDSNEAAAVPHGLQRLLLLCNSFSEHAQAVYHKVDAGTAAQTDAVCALLQVAPTAVQELRLDKTLTKSTCKDEDVRQRLQLALSSLSIHSFVGQPGEGGGGGGIHSFVGQPGEGGGGGGGGGGGERGIGGLPGRPSNLKPPRDSIVEGEEM